ncbi:MAG: hypothetical protein Q8896_05790, partial [Bacteroidota bacterium]|nr:hypothetical protein [Bacteroidota bacterium]
SGIWTDSDIWEKNEADVWLKPVEGIYPGEKSNRNVDVTISEGAAVTIGQNDVVRINSLSVINGRLTVEGALIVGPAEDEQESSLAQNEPNSEASAPDPIVNERNTGVPQLLQNVPNPLAPQFGYETTIKFYLDRSYPGVRLAVYDLLGHVIQQIYSESNPSEGWHTVKVRIEDLQSGSYPLVLELPNVVLRKMITVLR